MPSAHVLNRVAVQRTPRVMQLEGMFDLPARGVSEFALEADLPLEGRPWAVGLVVGPSGTGKTSLAKQLWPGRVVAGYKWSANRSVVDDFPKSLSIKRVVALLNSVGFSSPPAWLRPHGCLSNGERFRVTLARSLAEALASRVSPAEALASRVSPAEAGAGEPGLVVFDEFTSVVDRTVARVASAAVAKAVRREAGAVRFVAVTCHDDVENWLQPDWKFDTLSGEFAWRSVQPRPRVTLRVRRCPRNAWGVFRRHHYLSESLSSLCKCFSGSVVNPDGSERLAVFTAVVSFPHPRKPGWREHRTVCLPDFQGVGLGSAMADFIAGVLAATGKPYRSVSSHPAMAAHRARSKLWRTVRSASVMPKNNRGNVMMYGVPDFAHQGTRDKAFTKSSSHLRLTTTYEYCGPRLLSHARAFGLLPPLVS